MPHGIDALMDAVQPTPRGAPPDPAVVDADRDQLPPADDAMLPRSQLAYPDIRVCAGILSLRA
jgi:hypothetical protein